MPYQPAVLGSARLNNFRLDYLTPAQAAERPNHIRIILGGIDITRPDSPMRVIYKSLTIRDALFEAPNTCALTIYGAAPNVGQPIEVWINSDTPVLLFSGELQTCDRTYKGRPGTVIYPVTAIDDAARANRRRPLRPYVNVSATTIAQELIATYAPGFSSAGVEAGLPAVTITFDGSEAGMKGCLTALAKLIGGYWFFENKTLYLFVTAPGIPPDPIDDTPGRFLHDPAIRWSMDKSQVRTRVYGKGASTRIVASLAAGAASVPVANAEMFTASGGQAIAGVTPDGAASRVLTYTGVQLGGGGGLVGPGASPSAPPVLAVVPGAGIESGVHSYAITFTTASGETAPSPIAVAVVGVTAAPPVSPVIGAVQAGGAIEPGSFYYGVTFVTASGETDSPAASGPVTVAGAGGYYVPAPTAKLSAANESPDPDEFGYSHQAWNVGDQITYRFAFVNAAGVTTLGPASNAVTGVAKTGQPGYVRAIQLKNIQVSPDLSVTAKRIYRYRNGVNQGHWDLPNGYETDGPEGGTGLVGGAPPSSNTAFVPGSAYQTVPLSGIAIGPAYVTARRLYRWNGSVWRLLATIANNTQTTYTDAAATASLGGTLPASNTATANQVGVTFATGGGSVTGRKIYRTVAGGGGALRLLSTIANNTQTAMTDSTSDALLGADAPAGDTSGLTQPNGQVPAGSTSLIVANAAPFASGGGWAVIGNGDQVIRYAGKTATSLTGIPASGSGAIVASIAYNSTVTAAAALLGVSGVLDAVIRNAPIFVWVQRDDLAAQSYMTELDGGGDGVYEHIWSDERRSEASLRQVCDAQLALYSRPIVTVTYATRDQKTKSGKTATIALVTPAIAESLTIQEVTISGLGVSGQAPKFTVTASNARQSFEAILQMLIRKADA